MVYVSQYSIIQKNYNLSGMTSTAPENMDGHCVQLLAKRAGHWRLLSTIREKIHSQHLSPIIMKVKEHKETERNI